MKLRKLFYLLLPILSIGLIQCSDDDVDDVDTSPTTLEIPAAPVLNLNPTLVAEGEDIFRFSTFGDEVFWSGALQLDKTILGEANGGIGEGISPNLALSLGLKVDAEALPQSVVDAIVAGEVDLDDPATTIDLLRLNAVLGVIGQFDVDNNLTSVGVNCALCHSVVDNSFAPGIGSRLDGWPNRDVNVGAIIAATNVAPLAGVLGVDVPTAQAVLNNWGPGRFDGALLLDGQPTNNGEFIPASVIPAIFGLQGVDPVAYSGFGTLAEWINFVAVVELGGQGNYNDPRLNDAQFPIAVQQGSFNVVADNDIFGPQAAALEEFILSLSAPEPDPASFDTPSAIRGQVLFNGKAQCISCHAGNTFTDNLLRNPEEIGIDGILANRYPSGQYRTPPLRALFTKQTEGYFHDGRFATLPDVINHYNDFMDLELTEDERSDLEQYLNAL